MTILPEEFAAALTFLPAENIPGLPYYADSPGAPNVVILRSNSRSQIPTVGAVSGLIEDFRPELIIVLGIAGGIEGREGIKLGDVVVPDYLHYWGFFKLQRGARLARYFPYDQPTASIRGSFVDVAAFGAQKARWVEVLNHDEQAREPRVVIEGSLVAGEKLWGDPTSEEQQAMIDTFTDAVAVDMESVGAARAVHDQRHTVDYNPRLLVVRGISDLIRSGPDGATANAEERAAWKTPACRVAAAFTADIVARYVSTPDPRT